MEMRTLSKITEDIQFVEALLQKKTNESLAEAKSMIYSLKESFPDSPYVIYLEGALAIFEERFSDATRLLSKAASINPGVSLFHEGLSNLLRRQGEFNQSLMEATLAHVTGKNDHERGSANISLSRTLIEMYEFENAGLTLDQVVLYSPMRGDFYSTMFVYLLATGKVKQAVDLIDPVRASFIPEVPLGSFPPRSSSVIGTFRPLFYLVATLVGQGFSSDLIFNCITQPPSDLLPETPEYMEWWRKQLHKPGWLPTTMRFAEMLALGEQLLEEDPSTKLMLHEELKNSLLWLFSAETVAESKNLLPGLPHLTLSPHGELVAEWWGADEKKLTFYLSPSEKYYLRSWGPHIDEQMQDGDLESVEHGASQLYWLRGTDNV